ncbi:hypothetical protein ACVBEH_08785 [Roseateles sp. GG27B]
MARSLVIKPQMLLMDEPTSSMDAQSEMAFLRQLRDAAGNCTLVVVTHRPAVLELVTRIVVVVRPRRAGWAARPGAGSAVWRQAHGRSSCRRRGWCGCRSAQAPGQSAGAATGLGLNEAAPSLTWPNKTRKR